jgi:hypothetical protein
MLLIFLAGCNEELTDKSNLREQLLNLRPEDQVKWNERYGDNLESQQTANIVLAIQVINRQGEVIKQIDKRLTVLEKVSDPNGAPNK